MLLDLLPGSSMLLQVAKATVVLAKATRQHVLWAKLAVPVLTDTAIDIVGIESGGIQAGTCAPLGVDAATSRC